MSDTPPILPADSTLKLISYPWRYRPVQIVRFGVSRLPHRALRGAVSYSRNRLTLFPGDENSAYASSLTIPNAISLYSTRIH